MSLLFENPENEKRSICLLNKIETNPNDIENRMELARIFLSEGMIENAITQLENVIQLDSYNIQAYLLLSLAIQKRPNPDLSKLTELLEKATEIAPENADAHLNLAHVYEKLREEEKAINEFEKTVELSRDPSTLISAHLGLMGIFKRRGELEKANEEYVKAQKIYPDIEEMIKQVEINRLTPIPEISLGLGEDGIHPPHEKRMEKIQEEIKKLSESEK